MTHVATDATFASFRQSAVIALGDVALQRALDGATARFVHHRAEALAEFPNAEPLRDHFKALREATLARLAEHLETFEQRATAAGAQVHWAPDGAEARRLVLEIARRCGARSAVKSKSMVSEEIHLNQALELAGVEPVETDLGEWLIQQRGEPPSHIIAPAIHMTREQAAEVINRAADKQLPADDINALAAEARALLRERFLAAELGISGGNLLVAETGSLVLVENEGNIRLTTSAPRVHVAIVGIEKVARTWDDAAVWLQLLARSATGQPMSIYTSIITGPARPDDPDGPRELHIILLDNGRSALLGTPYEEALQCIRCGACLNACPVYRAVGGHAYGSPYSGPIGAVITPLLFGLERYAALPHASTLCGACRDVCPARIDLPRMLLALRQDVAEQGLLPRAERTLEATAAAVLRHAGLLRVAGGLGRLLQKPLAADGRLALPGRWRPAGERDLPALATKPFRDRWRDGEL